MKSEIDWDSPNNGIVDFEDLEQTETGMPLRKEPIAKPKTGFNINFRDLEDVVAALTAAEMQMQNTLIELRKLDGIAKQAKAINELDTVKILEQLEKIGFTQIAQKITDGLKKELESQKKEIYASSSSLEIAAKDISARAESLRVVADEFKNLDSMAQDLDEFVQKFKKMSTKSLYLGVIVATITGIFAGSILSYSLQLVGGGGDGARWLEFANSHNLKLEQDQSGLDVLIMPKSQQIMGRNQENLTMWIFQQPQEIKK